MLTGKLVFLKYSIQTLTSAVAAVESTDSLTVFSAPASGILQIQG